MPWDFSITHKVTRYSFMLVMLVLELVQSHQWIPAGSHLNLLFDKNDILSFWTQHVFQFTGKILKIKYFLTLCYSYGSLFQFQHLQGTFKNSTKDSDYEENYTLCNKINFIICSVFHELFERPFCMCIFNGPTNMYHSHCIVSCYNTASTFVIAVYK